jgi:hypothetical protein
MVLERDARFLLNFREVGGLSLWPSVKGLIICSELAILPVINIFEDAQVYKKCVKLTRRFQV